MGPMFSTLRLEDDLLPDSGYLLLPLLLNKSNTIELSSRP